MHPVPHHQALRGEHLRRVGVIRIHPLTFKSLNNLAGSVNIFPTYRDMKRTRYFLAGHIGKPPAPRPQYRHKTCRVYTTQAVLTALPWGVPDRIGQGASANCGNAALPIANPLTRPAFAFRQDLICGVQTTELTVSAPGLLFLEGIPHVAYVP